MKQRDTDKNKVVLTNNLQQRGASKLRREIEFVLIYQTKALQITEDDFHITNDRRKQRKNGVDNGKTICKRDRDSMSNCKETKSDCFRFFHF